MLFRSLRAFRSISQTRKLLMATPPPPPQSEETNQLPHHNPPSLPTSPAPQPKRTKMTQASPISPTKMSTTADQANDPAARRTLDAINEEKAMHHLRIPLQVKLLRDGAKAPTRGSAYSAGYDLYVSESGVIPARGKAMLATGISIACPPGTYARVAPRSGLAAKHSLQTGAGVIDFDYRGEVKLLLFNHSDEDFNVEAGDRMAQLVIERIVNPEIEVVAELEGTERGVGGFGSTGGFGGGAGTKDKV